MISKTQLLSSVSEAAKKGNYTEVENILNKYMSGFPYKCNIKVSKSKPNKSPDGKDQVWAVNIKVDGNSLWVSCYGGNMAYAVVDWIGQPFSTKGRLLKFGSSKKDPWAGYSYD